jgi:hypothetical protein
MGDGEALHLPNGRIKESDPSIEARTGEKKRFKGIGSIKNCVYRWCPNIKIAIYILIFLRPVRCIEAA